LHNNRPKFPLFPIVFRAAGRFCKLPLLRAVFNRKLGSNSYAICSSGGAYGVCTDERRAEGADNLIQQGEGGRRALDVARVALLAVPAPSAQPNQQRSRLNLLETEPDEKRATKFHTKISQVNGSAGTAPPLSLAAPAAHEAP